MQGSMLKFTLKESLSLVRIVTKHSGLEMLSGHIKREFVIMVTSFQDQEDIEVA